MLTSNNSTIPYSQSTILATKSIFYYRNSTIYYYLITIAFNNTKLTYTDDDVVKGKRYFYRVRGYNRRGYPWLWRVERTIE
jgi:hypothetical protein